MRNKRFVQWCIVAACLGATLVLTVRNLAGEKAKDKTKNTKVTQANYRGLLGEGDHRIRVEGNKTYIWSGMNDATGEPEWFDFTGAPMPPSELQFGIGKDRIRSIDDPLYVDPDDPRLMKLGVSPYRRDERPESTDDLMVIGFADGDDARAYPIALLDSHELVNDKINGKPVTVGWWPLAQLSVVHGRKVKEGKLEEFGTSGYVHKNVFLIFDRQTDSLWYPLDTEKWTAISGPRKGETLPFIAEPPPVKLGEWRKLHPTTKVLLGSKARYARQDRP